MTETPRDEIGVVGWNILYDNGNIWGAAPQANRLQSIVDTLSGLAVPLDVVGLVEVEDSEEFGHSGHQVARALSGMDGYWVANNRHSEYIGLFGAVTEPAVRDIYDGRRMMITNAYGITFALLHTTFDPRGDIIRCRQVEQALSALEDQDRVVLLGDFNSLPVQKSRRLIHNAGFVSVFSALGRKRPSTVITEKYRKFLNPLQKLVTTWGMAPDDIYVRGVEVSAAGVFEGDSDHRGLWAMVRI